MSLIQEEFSDDQDEVIGTMEKMEAHRKALLHRAFVCLFLTAKEDASAATCFE
jgi:isopentenyldiphosphate isomerase